MIDPSVRIYLLSGIPHTSGRAGVVGRALLTALDQWVSDGIAPPPSRVPRVDDGTLVDLAQWKERFPGIPGCLLPDSFYQPLRLDPGPRWDSEGIADFVPPRVGPAFTALVPQVDEDGNEIAGIRLPQVSVPLATFCGWRMRSPGFSRSLTRNSGRTWPLPDDESERLALGDERLSIATRYDSGDEYLSRIEAALTQLLADRLILPLDHDRLLEAARVRSDLIGKLPSLDDLAGKGTLAEAVTRVQRIRDAEIEWYYGPAVGPNAQYPGLRPHGNRRHGARRAHVSREYPAIPGGLECLG